MKLKSETMPEYHPAIFSTTIGNSLYNADPPGKELIRNGSIPHRKTRDYTVMTNHHVLNTALSLNAKRLLSLMLSLPENWDYTTKGLARICRDGVDSICATIKELEEQGYIIRERIRNSKEQLITIEYTIFE